MQFTFPESIANRGCYTFGLQIRKSETHRANKVYLQSPQQDTLKYKRKYKSENHTCIKRERLRDHSASLLKAAAKYAWQISRKETGKL